VLAFWISVFTNLVRVHLRRKLRRTCLNDMDSRTGQDCQPRWDDHTKIRGPIPVQVWIGSWLAALAPCLCNSRKLGVCRFIDRFVISRLGVQVPSPAPPFSGGFVTDDPHKEDTKRPCYHAHRPAVAIIEVDSRTRNSLTTGGAVKKTLLVLALVLWFALCITGCQAEIAGTTELPSTTIAATTTTIAPFSAAEFRAAHPSGAVFNEENWGELETAPDDHKGASVDVVAKLRDEAMLATADDGHVFWTWTVWIGHEDESWARTSLGLPPDFIAVCCTNPDPEGDSPLGSSVWVHLGGVVLGASDGEFGPRGSALVYVDSVEPSSPATTTTLTEAEYKAKCSRLNYDVLSKNPRSHAGEFYRFTGKIVDIKEDTTLTRRTPIP